MTIASDGEDTTLAPGALTIAPLRDGDVHTVRAVVERLGPRSRHQRFGRTELQSSDLALLAGVGDGRHVLVARAGSRPVAVAHLVRDGDPSSAEAAVMVADEWQGIGIGTALARRLAVDAAAAGIGRVHALIGGENRASLALMRRATRIVSRRFEGPDVFIVGEVREPRRPTCSSRSTAGMARPPVGSFSSGGSPGRTRAAPPPRWRRPPPPPPPPPPTRRSESDGRGIVTKLEERIREAGQRPSSSSGVEPEETFVGVPEPRFGLRVLTASAGRAG